MSYLIVAGASMVDLQTKVEEMIYRGWVPCGGVCTDGARWYQAMTKTP